MSDERRQRIEELREKIRRRDLAIGVERELPIQRARLSAVLNIPEQEVHFIGRDETDLFLKTREEHKIIEKLKQEFTYYGKWREHERGSFEQLLQQLHDVAPSKEVFLSDERFTRLLGFAKVDLKMIFARAFNLVSLDQDFVSGTAEDMSFRIEIDYTTERFELTDPRAPMYEIQLYGSFWAELFNKIPTG